MFAQFQQVITQQSLWPKQARILLAVSGGVDSIVLFDLLRRMRQEGLTLGVAHVNHQLREEAGQEAQYVRELCARYDVPLYETTWENPVTSGVEAAARDFRYQFFAEVMATHYYDYLVTAHHQDDQLETMLMKMARDGQFYTSSGIRAQQPFASGFLVRPLLNFTKETLREYAAANHLTYFEDASNNDLQFQRNRVRHEIVPLLKQENPQVTAHFQQLSEQLLWAQEIIATQQKAWLAKYVQKTPDWRINYKFSKDLTVGEQYYFLHAVFQEAAIPLSAQQQTNLLQQIASDQSQWTLTLKEGWCVVRQYDTLRIIRAAQEVARTSLTLTPSMQGQYLSEEAWIAFIPASRFAEVKLPDEVADWATFSVNLNEYTPSMLRLRKRQAGDRLALSPTLKKRISRYFIDRKVPNVQRDASWVVTNERDEVCGLLPYAFSYLSIAEETDKIHYILLYKYKQK